jgi:hypothetical protein
MMKYVGLLLFAVMTLQAETLFEVKDASNNKVLEVSTDGLRVMNLGDTLMVIGPNAIRANIREDKDKVLSRTFSVTTTSAKGKGSINALEVGTNYTTMGSEFGRYTDFSPANIFIGLNSGKTTAATAIDNVFLGNNAGFTNYEGDNNIFIGAESGYYNYGNGTWLNGDYNIFMGYRSGYKNNSGGCNIFIGDEAGRENLTGSHNIYIGTETGRDNTAGNANTCVGSDSFFGGSGSENTYIGWLAGSYATGSDNIFIGTDAGDYESASNRLFIDNSGTSTPLIYGEFDNDSLRVNGKLSVSGNSTVFGKLGVGVKPLYKIHSEDITATSDNPAIYGKHAVTDNWGIGVKGEGGYKGVQGLASATTGEIHGVEGIASGTGGTKVGVYGSASGGTTNWAGYFNGNIFATNITKSKDEVKIDHPLDPENKFLVHSGVSSNEMKNIYDGVVILDNNGKATVQLPEWFEALNTDFRYQMTAIGKPCPNLYISKKISNNGFEIAGGEPNAEISWQVTGIRKDSYALKNPIVQEIVKSAEDKNTNKDRK